MCFLYVTVVGVKALFQKSRAKTCKKRKKGIDFMTLQEILKAKGVTDEVIEAVLVDMKTNGVFTTRHENMDVRYPKLKGDFDTLTTQHGEAQRLIETMKAETQTSVALQEQVKTLTQQLEEQKVESAMDRCLTTAGAKPEDMDFLKFQWRKKGDITLDEHGEIKGGTDAIAGLKTQHPVHFASAQAGREIQPHTLQGRENGGDTTVTKETFEKMGYDARVKLKQESPELYTQLTKGN